MYEINTVAELVRACKDDLTGGYETEFEIQPNRERYEGFLVIEVRTNNPEPFLGLQGEWWFWDDDTVFQVL